MKRAKTSNSTTRPLLKLKGKEKLFYQKNKGFPGFLSRLRTKPNEQLFQNGGTLSLINFKKISEKEILDSKKKLKMNTLRFGDSNPLFLGINYAY